MSRKSWWLGGLLIALALNLGCCRWCDRHCGTGGNAGYAPVAYAPAPVCCTPAAAPAPAACPPGCAPAPQGFQRPTY